MTESLVVIADPANQTARDTNLRACHCRSEVYSGIFNVVDQNENPPVEVAHSWFVAVNGNAEVSRNEPTNDGGFWRNHSFRLQHISDSLSNNLFVGERGTNMSFASWTGAVTNGAVPAIRAPGPANFEDSAALVLAHCGPHLPNDPFVTDADATSSFHPGGVHFLIGDGSVRFISSSISQMTYDALATRAGGEVVGEY